MWRSGCGRLTDDSVRPALKAFASLKRAYFNLVVRSCCTDRNERHGGCASNFISRSIAVWTSNFFLCLFSLPSAP